MIENAMTQFSGLSWMGKSRFVAANAPMVIWGLGAAEGTIRTLFHGIASVFAKAAGYHETASEQFKQCKRDGKISFGCMGLTVLSAIPYVGPGIGYFYIFRQCIDYSRVRYAYREVLKIQKHSNLTNVLDQLDDINNIDHQELDRLSKQLRAPTTFTSSETQRIRETLKGTLVYHYYGYSIAYASVEYSCKGINFTANLIKNIAMRLFRNGFIRNLIYKVIKVTSDELNQVITDTSKNPRPTSSTNRPRPVIEINEGPLEQS